MRDVYACGMAMLHRMLMFKLQDSDKWMELQDSHSCMLQQLVLAVCNMRDVEDQLKGMLRVVFPGCLLATADKLPMARQQRHSTSAKRPISQRSERLLLLHTYLVPCSYILYRLKMQAEMASLCVASVDG